VNDNPLTDLLRLLPEANRRDGSEWDDRFWRRVAERLSNVAWDEQGKLVDLQQELPNLVLKAQLDMPSVKVAEQEQEQEDFWAEYDEMSEIVHQEFLAGYPVLYDTRTGRCFVPRRDYERNRSDEKYRRIQAGWCLLQMEEEGVSTYRYEDEGKWKTTKRRLNRKGIRHRTFPQPDGVIILVSSLDGVKLPPDREEWLEMIGEWIARIPDGKRIGGTRDFGGKRLKGLEPKGDRRYIRLNKYHIDQVRSIAERDEMLDWESRDGKMLALKTERWETEEQRQEGIEKVTKWVRKAFLSGRPKNGMSL
jgi:hypothetical protein